MLALSIRVALLVLALAAPPAWAGDCIRAEVDMRVAQEALDIGLQEMRSQDLNLGSCLSLFEPAAMRQGWAAVEAEANRACAPKRQAHQTAIKTAEDMAGKLAAALASYAACMR